MTRCFVASCFFQLRTRQKLEGSVSKGAHASATAAIGRQDAAPGAMLDHGRLKATLGLCAHGCPH